MRLAPIMLLTAALGCAQQSPKPGTNALQEQIVAQERAGLDALKTGDLEAFGNATSEDAIFVDAQGIATKAEVMQHVTAFRLREYTLTGVRFLPLSPDSGLIAYDIVESGTSHGRDFTARVHISSLWRKRDGKWMCAFSQETAAR